MQAKREKNHNNSNHAPISTFTHNKIRPLPPVLAAPRPLAATGFEAIENATAMRNGKKGADRPVCSFFAVPHRCCVLNCFKACGCKGSRRGENRRERAYFVMSERANWRVI